ncbi:MAG: hypothetical protein AB1589_32590 [Cyanobacteriota bacterium]
MTTLFRRLQPAKKFRITIGAIAQLLRIPKHLMCALNAGRISSLSTALMKVGNSSVTADYNIGSMPSLTKFKTVQLAKNCSNYGLPLNKIGKNTKSSTTRKVIPF